MIYAFLVPGAPPTTIAVSSASHTSLNVTWSDIVEDKRYGIIISYAVNYSRTDGKGEHKQMIVNDQYATLEGLFASQGYDIFVAGMTAKGIGTYSSKKHGITLESSKFFFVIFTLTAVSTNQNLIGYCRSCVEV